MEMKLNKKRLGKWFLYFFLAFLYLPPQIIEVWPVLSPISVVLRNLRLLAGCWILLLEVLKCIRSNRIKWGWEFLSQVIIQIWILVACVVNSGISVATSHLFTMVTILSYCMVVIWAFRKKEEDGFLNATSVYCVIICSFNLVSQLVLGERGLYYDSMISWQAFYLCGNDNYFVFFYLFSAAVVILNDIRRSKISLMSYLFCMMLVVSMAISKSTTGLMTLSALLVFMVLSIRIIRQWLVKHSSKLLVVGMVITIWFVAFRGWDVPFVKDIIYAVTQEDVSMLARGLIWNSAIERILESPILGHGTAVYNFAYTSLEGARSAHNMYLQLAYYGGFVSLILLISMIIGTFVNLRRVGGSGLGYPIVLLILYLCAFMFEQNPFYVGFYAVIIMINNCKNKEYFKGE